MASSVGCFFGVHKYQMVMLPELLLFVVAKRFEMPTGIQCFAAFECSCCGKRQARKLYNKVPELSIMKAGLWAAHKLGTDQLQNHELGYVYMIMEDKFEPVPQYLASIELLETDPPKGRPKLELVKC